jgi:single-stranded DNA-specific DHH superfamily exonuclease
MNIVERLDKLLKEESIILESGFRNMKSLSKKWKKAKIYFHKDLDGVTSGIAIKKYIEDYGIKVVDAEPIQYGGEEYAVKKTPKDVMPVLVDFGHGKVNMVLYTDHHDHTDRREQTRSTRQR